MLKQFHALPTEERAAGMKGRDYLWCLTNQLLDDEEELERLCPACRAQAQENRCPVCGAPSGQNTAGVNASFDIERFMALKGAERA